MSDKQQERYEELAENYGIDVSQPTDYYATQRTLIIAIMEHLQRLDKVVYMDSNLKKLGVKPFNPLDVIGKPSPLPVDLTDGAKLVDELNNMLDELKEPEVISVDEMYKRMHDYIDKHRGIEHIDGHEIVRGHDMINNESDVLVIPEVLRQHDEPLRCGHHLTPLVDGKCKYCEANEKDKEGFVV